MRDFDDDLFSGTTQSACAWISTTCSYWLSGLWPAMLLWRGEPAAFTYTELRNWGRHLQPSWALSPRIMKSVRKRRALMDCLPEGKAKRGWL